MKGFRVKTFLIAVLMLLILTVMVIKNNIQKKEIVSVYFDTYNKIHVEVVNLANSLDEECDTIEKLEEDELEDIINIIKDSEKSLYLYSKDLPMSVDFETKEIQQLLNYDFLRLTDSLKRSLLDKKENSSISLTELQRLSQSLNELCSKLKIEDNTEEDYTEILTKGNIIKEYIDLLETETN